MRYYTRLGAEEKNVDIEPLDGSRFRITIGNDSPRVIDAEHVEGRVVHMLVDGRSHDVDVEEEGTSLNVLVEDSIYRLEMLDERKHRLQAARGKFQVSGPQTIRAPMPGKIVKILVEKGATVEEGQGVIVIEAMKMENELRAPKAGRVAEIFVSEGQTVENRADLVSIE
jgi:biotin carboxyl carrier protein